MLALVLLGLYVLAHAAHGFTVQQPDAFDNAWQFSRDGTAANKPMLADEPEGRLVEDFQIKGFESYDAEVAGSEHIANANQFQEDQFDSQDSSSSDDEGYVYNARLQFPPNNAASYNSNRFSTLPEGFSAPASQFNRESSSASYVLGVPQEKAESPNPNNVHDAHAGSADAASLSTVQQESSGDQVEPAKGHQGPVSYYTPASDRNGAFVFYDTRSDGEKQQVISASSDATTSASTSPILAAQQGAQGAHGCPSSYWAGHLEEWPAPLKVSTFVSRAFAGAIVKKNLEIIYGTTTLFQGLLDTRDDPYSKLLRHSVAALLNARAMPAFPLRPAEVAALFNSALASKAAAAAQAQKFENENHAFGDTECK